MIGGVRARGRVLGLATLGALTASCDNSPIWHAPRIHEERMQIPRYKRAYNPSTVFPDGKAMRHPPAGTVPRGEPEPAWKTASGYVDTIPVQVTRDFVLQGRANFDVSCAACHGVLGDGDSVVAKKMELRAPPSLLSDHIRTLKPGRLYEIVRDGYGLMPGYTVQMPDPGDRWAVVAYVRALQISQGAHVDELPPDVRRELEKEAP